MTEPKIGDQVKTRHGWRRITAFSEDTGTQLDDLRWICASALHLFAVAQTGGVNTWVHDPAKLPKAGGWDWIEEGERISAESRRIASLKEEAMAESIVFNHEMIDEGELDALKAAAASRPARPCREDGFCDAVYRENDRGGEAREIVGLLAEMVGVNLGASHEGPRPLDGNVWSPRNMMRVVQAVQEVLGEHESLRKELHDRDKKDDRTVAALREALIHAGEAV